MADAPQPSFYRDQGRDEFANIDPNGVKLVTEEPVSTFSVDVDTAPYAFMRGALNRGVLPQKDAVRVEELVNYFDYGYSVPQNREIPFAAQVSVMPTLGTTTQGCCRSASRAMNCRGPKHRRPTLCS